MTENRILQRKNCKNIQGFICEPRIKLLHNKYCKLYDQLCIRWHQLNVLHDRRSLSEGLPWPVHSLVTRPLMKCPQHILPSPAIMHACVHTRTTAITSLNTVFEPRTRSHAFGMTRPRLLFGRWADFNDVAPRAPWIREGRSPT